MSKKHKKRARKEFREGKRDIRRAIYGLFKEQEKSLKLENRAELGEYTFYKPYDCSEYEENAAADNALYSYHDARGQ